MGFRGARENLRSGFLDGLSWCISLYGSLALLRQLFLPLVFGFDVLFLHDLNGFEVLLNILVLAAFDGAVRRMNGVAEVLLEKGVDAKNRVFLPLRLHHLAHAPRANVAAILEVAGVDGVLANFVENFPALGPCRKYARRSGGL